MGAQRNDLAPNLLNVQIGTQAASITLPGPLFRKHARIIGINYVDQAGIVADNTNFLQLSLQKLDGTVLAALDTRAANDGAVTALTAKLLSQVGEIDLPAGTQIKLVITKNGTGVPTQAQLQIEWYPL